MAVNLLTTASSGFKCLASRAAPGSHLMLLQAAAAAEQQGVLAAIQAQQLLHATAAAVWHKAHLQQQRRRLLASAAPGTQMQAEGHTQQQTQAAPHLLQYQRRCSCWSSSRWCWQGCKRTSPHRRCSCAPVATSSQAA